MKWFILILSCCSALAQHPLLTGAGIDWTRASSANITNFPITTLGAEHYWLASDLPQATIFPATGWRDRIVDVDTNAWITNNVIKGWPTNRSDGLQFIGNESLVLSNSVLGKSNISITNPSIRAVFMVVSSTKATASYFFVRQSPRETMPGYGGIIVEALEPLLEIGCTMIREVPRMIWEGRIVSKTMEPFRMLESLAPHQLLQS